MRYIREANTKTVKIGYEDDDFEEHEVLFEVPKGKKGTEIARDFSNLYNVPLSRVWIIREDWANSFRDKVFPNETLDIFRDPDSKEWGEISGQSRRLQIPVRFVFVIPANELYVGAVPFHFNLADQARKDYGSNQRERISGIVDPIKKQYSIEVRKNTPKESQEAFYDTVFWNRVLKNYKEVRELGGMAGEVV